MKKDILRREFIKWKLNTHSYLECKILLDKVYGYSVAIRTLKRWWKRFNQGDWNLRDTSQRPKRIHYKFSAEEIDAVIDLRRNMGYSAYQLKQIGISMSESMMKRIIKGLCICLEAIRWRA